MNTTFKPADAASAINIGAPPKKKGGPTVRLPIPEVLADIALVDANTCAAVGSMKISWWHGEVQAGRAPPPVICQPRCTRWRLADVRAFWVERVERAAAGNNAALMTARAAKASAAAQLARRARQAIETGAMCKVADDVKEAGRSAEQKMPTADPTMRTSGGVRGPLEKHITTPLAAGRGAGASAALQSSLTCDEATADALRGDRADSEILAEVGRQGGAT